MALRLNYLLSVLMRSSKFISIMIGTLIFKSHGHENFTKRNIFLAFCMTAGVFIFHLGDSHKQSAATELLGVFFGALSLLSDYLVSSYQNNLKHTHKIDFYDLILGTNLWCLIFTIILGLFKNEFYDAGVFMMEYPIVIWDIIVSSLVKMVGVYVVFYHIHTFGPISLAYITTVRKVFTVLLSFIIFNHKLNNLRIVGVCVVFMVIIFDMFDALSKETKKSHSKDKIKQKKD